MIPFTKLLIALSALITSSFVVGHINSTNENEIKKWYDGHLEASDFTPVQSLPNNRMAFSAITIDMNYNYEFSKSKSKCYAYAAFDKQFSKISVSANIKDLNGIVRHEQGHFDLAEYETRLLNKAILNVSDFKVVDKIYLTYQNKFDSLQRLYDFETNFSLNEAAQKKWRQKIDKLMESVTGAN